MNKDEMTREFVRFISGYVNVEEATVEENCGTLYVSDNNKSYAISIMECEDD